MSERPLILASTSPYRRQLLERLGVPFTTAAPDADETPCPGEPPETLVVRLAEAKARAVAAAHPDALVIGSDQVASGELSEAAIQAYLDREPAFDCAGAFKSEGLGIALCQRMEGEDPTALLPAADPPLSDVGGGGPTGHLRVGARIKVAK